MHDYYDLDWAVIDDVIDNDLDLLARQIRALRELHIRSMDESS